MWTVEMRLWCSALSSSLPARRPFGISRTRPKRTSTRIALGAASGSRNNSRRLLRARDRPALSQERRLAMLLGLPQIKPQPIAIA